jgi:hypothetical protein
VQEEEARKGRWVPPGGTRRDGVPVKASASLCQGREETTTRSAQRTISLLRKSSARVEASCPAHLALGRGMRVLSEKPLSSWEGKMHVVRGRRSPGRSLRAGEGDREGRQLARGRAADERDGRCDDRTRMGLDEGFVWRPGEGDVHEGVVHEAGTGYGALNWWRSKRRQFGTFRYAPPYHCTGVGPRRGAETLPDCCERWDERKRRFGWRRH